MAVSWCGKVGFSAKRGITESSIDTQKSGEILQNNIASKSQTVLLWWPCGLGICHKLERLGVQIWA